MLVGRIDTQGIPARSGTISMAWVYCVRTSPLALMPFGQVNDEGIADTAAVGLALPAPEGGIASPGPAPGVMVEGIGSAQFVDLFQVLFQRFGDIVEEQVLIDEPVGPPSELAPLSESTMIRVFSNSSMLFKKSSRRPIWWSVCSKETGKDLHHAGI